MKVTAVALMVCALTPGLGCSETRDDTVMDGLAASSAGAAGIPMGSVGAAGRAGMAATGGAGEAAAAGGGGGAAGAAGSAGAAGATATAGTGGAAGATDAGFGGAGGSPGGGMPCSGKPGAKRGKSNQMLMAGGAARTFVYYAPSTLDPNVAAPLVIVPHGFTMSGEAMFNITGYDAIADREGFVVAYPNGIGAPGPWNVGAGVCGVGAAVPGAANDQALIDELMNFVEADQCLDRDHVFVTGFSMGGYFSNETGCQRDDITAIGPHSGGSHPLMSCPGGPKPVIVFHGDRDGLITVNCGVEARDRWAEKNGCGSEVDVVTVENGTCEYSKDCPEGAQVALCLFTGMDHGWAGGTAGQPFAFPEYESASELGWKFFREHAW